MYQIMMKYSAHNKLGEFGGTPNVETRTIPSQAYSHLYEGVETTGGKMGFLNNQLERPTL